MASKLWDVCEPDAEQTALLEELDFLVRGVGLSRKSSGEEDYPVLSPGEERSSDPETCSSSVIKGDCFSCDEIHDSLHTVEQACKLFIDNVDDILGVLEKVEQAHSDVTGRTNILMLNCETLLEQQHALQDVVDQLRDIITPFNDVEAVAGLLGIPVNASGRAYVSQASSLSSAAPLTIDPRSSEFHNVLSRISLALKCVGERCSSLRDSAQYLSWLKQLQRRANSLLAKAMLNLLENASKICLQDGTRAEMSSSRAASAPALETMLVYTKFRGLGFRMRELGYMLRCSELSESEGTSLPDMDTTRSAYSSEDFLSHFSSARHAGNSSSGGEVVRSARGDVLAAFSHIRCELLGPVVRGASMRGKVQGALSGGEGLPPHELCTIVRSAFASAFHVAQLEQQLYVTLFHTTGSAGSNAAASSSMERNELEERAIRGREEADTFAEVGHIVGEICSEINGYLRALIIKGAVTVSGLCRVIHTITEDVQSQLDGTRLHQTVYTTLHDSLQRTSSDARERLVFCAEVELRKNVLLFDPLPSQLAYPDLLQGTAESKGGTNTAAARLLAKSNKSKGGGGDQQAIEEDNDGDSESSSGDSGDISRTWYPPLRHTLSLLSLLFGVVDPAVFEDLARRGVAACIESLTRGAVGVRRWRDQLHGDLFLVRHLLILREQLLPFDISLQSIEKYLDFSPTGSALSSFVANSRSLLRMDTSNSLLHLAVDGLPGVCESHIDVKKRMDEHLKASCQALRTSALHFLLGPLESFLAKVSAFIGSDIPLYRYESSEYERNLEQDREQSVVLPPEACESLKKQSFVKPDRIKTMLGAVLHAVKEAGPVFSAAGRLYVENTVTRDIILKPVYQDLAFAVRRMRTVIVSSCVSAEERRELEGLLSAVR